MHLPGDFLLVLLGEGDTQVLVLDIHEEGGHLDQDNHHIQLVNLGNQMEERLVHLDSQMGEHLVHRDIQMKDSQVVVVLLMLDSRQDTDCQGEEDLLHMQGEHLAMECVWVLLVLM